MSVSYKKFIKSLESKGLSLNQLRVLGVINPHTYEKMLRDDPVNVKWIASICKYLDVPIEQIVEIIPDEE